MSMMATSRRRMAGFTLIEMMVAMAIGLIVAIAVIAFIVSIMRSNNQTIQATRLTQEMRATMAVITADLKRARSVADPLAAASSNDLVYGQLAMIDMATAGCIKYGYQGEAGTVFRTVSASNSRIVVATGNAPNPACASGSQIGSDQVSVTALTFNPINSRQIDVSMTGTLAAPGAGMDGITRTISETVYVRSR